MPSRTGAGSDLQAIINDYIRHELANNSALLGKRIRVSGWLKTSNVANRAGASLVIINEDGHVFASDPMTDRRFRDLRTATKRNPSLQRDRRCLPFPLRQLLSSLLRPLANLDRPRTSSNWKTATPQRRPR